MPRPALPPTRRQFLAESAMLAGGLYLADVLRPGGGRRQSGRRVNVRHLGAVGDGRMDDTFAIQKAIDRAAGGGVVLIPPGTYRVGTLVLRSGLRLELADGAVLLGSPNDADFAPVELSPALFVADVETADFANALLSGDGLEDVEIVGAGRIDGNRSRRGGPKPIALQSCRQVLISGIQVANAPSYAVSLLGCDQVRVEQVTVENAHADGIDADCCTRVRITGCTVDALDDGICLKASAVLGDPHPTEDVVVSGCTVRSSSCALKLGSESANAFRRIVLRDCTLLHRPAPGVAPEIAEDGGVALEVVDGGALEDVTVEDIAMRGIGAPLFVRLGDRWRGGEEDRIGTLRRVTMRRITATGARVTSSITGLGDAPVEDVVLADVHLAGSTPTTEPLPDGLGVPEAPLAYPRPTMFGTLPASGLYCRHVTGLRIERLGLHGAPDDRRPPIVLDDTASATLTEVAAPGLSGAAAVVWVNDGRDVAVHATETPPGMPAFLRVTGARSARIRLEQASAAAHVQPIEIAPEVLGSAVTRRG